jgi:uncharacterized protein YqeY
MSIKEQIEADLKQAMLGGDKILTETLRGIKSAILNVEVAENKRETGLTDEEVTTLLQKEAKKRQESADLFKQGGNEEKSLAEQAEKTVIEKYLPAQLSDAELDALIQSAIDELNASGPQAMGQVIGLVKQRSGGQADGGRIALKVKEKLV